MCTPAHLPLLPRCRRSLPLLGRLVNHLVEQLRQGGVGTMGN